jgi:hypothetical protein
MGWGIGGSFGAEWAHWIGSALIVGGLGRKGVGGERAVSARARLTSPQKSTLQEKSSY